MTEDPEAAIPEIYHLYRFMVPATFIDKRTLAFAGIEVQ